MEHNKPVSQNKMKVVNILSAPSSTPLAWRETRFPPSHIESIKPNLEQLIWVWETDTIRGSLVTYPGTFAISLQPDFTLGFVLSDDKLNGILSLPCGRKTCQPPREMTSCYLRTTPSLLLSSVIIRDNMHNSSLPFRISHGTKKRHIGLFAQYWQTELLQ